MTSLQNDLNVLNTYNSSNSNYAVASTNRLLLPSAKADTGASAHFLKEDHAKLLTNCKSATTNLDATLPDNSKIRASEQGIPPYKHLSESAKLATVYPGLTNESLLSIGQFCNDNCITMFTKADIYIIKDKKIILHGTIRIM